MLKIAAALIRLNIGTFSPFEKRWKTAGDVISGKHVEICGIYFGENSEMAIAETVSEKFKIKHFIFEGGGVQRL